MSFKFGRTSISRLATCHNDLILIHEMAIKTSPIDYGIAEGHRSRERQLELFEQGLTKVMESKHNVTPSMATDIYVWHPEIDWRKQIAYDPQHLCLVAGVLISCARELLERGSISHNLRWGGNWDSDGIIVYDQTFIDLVHFELI